MGRGERLIKLGHSWFSATSIDVVPRMKRMWCRALNGYGLGFPDTKLMETSKTHFCSFGSQSLGAKVQGQEGNSPDRPPRSYRPFLSEKGIRAAVTAKRWAWKQPSLRDRVTAQWPSPKHKNINILVFWWSGSDNGEGLKKRHRSDGYTNLSKTLFWYTVAERRRPYLVSR